MNASCQSAGKPADKDCGELYKQANVKLNEYYQQADQHKLDTALGLLENSMQACPDYKTRMINLKIRILILARAYDKGYRFIDSLETEKFDKPYKKNFYLKSFKAIGLNVQGDSVYRDVQYREIIDEIQVYMKSHPSDNEAVADLFFTKVKVEDRATVLKQIDSMQQQSKNKDSIFYEGLKTAIGGEGATGSAIQVP